ncbi:MAG: hypothetical protein FP826_01310 [Sphingomonadales bacterium]|nr:hypothetical protein [Sphingomonadales bacterium]MBU3993701.1 hypothetical protein [Alphaproteobacteria bacterium]
MATSASEAGRQPQDTGASDDFGVLLGWSHAPFTRGIQLKLQSTIGDNRDHDTIAARHYLMTKNQALILAKYLLDATGQTLPEGPREGRLRRMMRRLSGG